MTSHARSLAAWIFTCALLGCGDDDSTDPKHPDAGHDAGMDAGSDPLPQIVDRSAYSNVGVEGSLDYENPAYWVCRPDLENNECHADLDATEIKADGTLLLQPHVRAEDPAIDCFYVYPTMWLDKGPQMTDFSDVGVKLVQDALRSQAARFTSVCEVYAPLYRQAGLTGGAPDPTGSPALALQDARDAFQHYLKAFNKGRKFVLIGHSQGSIVLTELIKRDIDGNAALRSKLLSAILLGGMPYTPPGKKTGGSFQNIPPCSEPGETGCVVAFNSYPAEAPPNEGAVFGVVRPDLSAGELDPNGEVICTNPAPLAGHDGPYSETYFALQLNSSVFGPIPAPPAGVTTPFVVFRELLRGECMKTNGHHYLSVSSTAGADDVRKPVYRTPILETLGFGTHLVDFSLVLGDLLEIVRRQAKLN
ncbi:MAG TPA: alpha/beta fold hydrolase [Polyangiales bacterium]|nr:alpha/beta fold hydrolase [Polyangiales bacterium]